jgi:P-type Cu2+ transporter
MAHQHDSHSMNHTLAADQSAHALHAPSQTDPASHRAHLDHVGHEQLFRQRFWVCLVLSIPVLVLSPAIQEWLHFSIPVFPASEWITPLFSIAIFLYGGIPFLRMAIPEIANGQPGMMTLVSLAISVAFVYSLATLRADAGMGFFWELVTLIDVMLLGHWIEMRSVRLASRALDELTKLIPDRAERINLDGNVETVAISELKVNDLILIRPGASVPADGRVAEGESELNEAMITGESKPVNKAPGAQVIAGTINGEGSLRVRVSATGEATALAGIMRLVKQAQESKSQTQVLADKAAGWLFYGAIGIALLTGIAWTLALGLRSEVIERVATVLVIACPHALGLAIPLVVSITTTLGARNGILIRDRRALELAREVDFVIFDKTGTLTKGEQGVVELATANGLSKGQALALAGAVEADSEHVIARAIRNAAIAEKVSLPKVSNFEGLKGRGVRARLDGHTIAVGGPQLLKALNVSLPRSLEHFIETASAKGETVVYLLDDSNVQAAFSLSDLIRPESKRAVKELHDMGIQVAMLTGDSEAVAKAVAEELAIDRFYAQVLPEDKDQKVIELQKEGNHVAMVGDGVNDAPALTRADVGIAIGSGTDVAVESAGIILVKSNPLDVAKVIKLSRASYRKMIQNLFWATGYNIVALPLAAGILAPIGIVLSPAVGALMMSLSTVIVAINAQLLRREGSFG